MKPTVIFLMGPTAAGKTALAIELARRLPGGIISVDSAMVYRGMDIGTAKPGPDVLAAAPHRLIDICDPLESYSAARFRDDALAASRELVAGRQVPLLTGGTMLYFSALEHGLSPLPCADPGIRMAIEAEARTLGWAALHARLMAVDPETASRVHPNDPQRIQRALEVYRITGRPMSALYREQRSHAPPYRIIKLIVAPAERAELHLRIARRFEQMLEQGFVDEVKTLYGRGDLHAGLPSMRCVGYRQIWEFLAGRTDYQTAVEKGIIATRQLAKRQLTWLRSDKRGQWFDAANKNMLDNVLKYLAGVQILKTST